MRPLFRRKRLMPDDEQQGIAPSRPTKLVTAKRQYKLTRRQKNRAKRWQTPDYNPQPYGFTSRLVSRLPLRFR